MNKTGVIQLFCITPFFYLQVFNIYEAIPILDAVSQDAVRSAV